MTMHVAFLGFCQTDADFDAILARDRAMPVQTQKFGWSVVSAIESAGGQVSILAAAPASDWPGNRAVFSGGSRAARLPSGMERRHDLLGFVNVLGLKHVTRYFSAVRGLKRIVDDGTVSAIMVHGVHSPFLHAAVRVGRAAGIPVITILTDAPADPEASGHPVVRWLRRVDHRLISRALRHMDGVIALTPGLAQTYAPGLPALLLVGIAPTMAPAGEGQSGGPLRVIYAGGLTPEYGIDLLVEAVTKSTGDWVLEVFGRGQLQDTIARQAAEDDRIDYGGVLTPAQLPAAYARADLLVNPRPPDQELVSYSFPSKLLEYMATGTPVLSTHLPTIPADFDAHLIYAEAEPASLASAVDEFLARSPEARRAFGRSCRRFIVEHYGPDAQGARMLDFVSSLGGERAGHPPVGGQT